MKSVDLLNLFQAIQFMWDTSMNTEESTINKAG